MRALIAIGGELKDKTWILKDIEADAYQYYIAADSGISHFFDLGIRCDYLIGDMDSVDPEHLSKLDPSVERLQLPVEKDWTDTEYAIHFALEKGASDIVLLGSFAKTRPDHLLANYMLISTCKENAVNCRFRLTDGLSMVEALQGPLSMQFDLEHLPQQDYIVSLIPISDSVEGVSYEGLAYPLERATLERGASRSISNYVLDRQVGFSISVDAGLALLFLTPED